MSRKIKFRAWDTENKKWIWTGFEKHTHESHGDRPDGVMVGTFHIYNSASSVEFSQMTGLKDKNGKEIYEGDICRKLNTDWPSKSDSDPRSIQEYMNDIASVGMVVFEDCEFQLSVKSRKYHDEYLNQSLRPGQHGFIEVIGNIYEHPDLLK